MVRTRISFSSCVVVGLAACVLIAPTPVVARDSFSFSFGYSEGGYGRHGYRDFRGHRGYGFPHRGYGWGHRSFEPWSYRPSYYAPPPVIYAPPPPVVYQAPPVYVPAYPSAYPSTAPLQAVPTGPAYQTSSGQYCREYQAQVIVGGGVQSSYGTACLQPDGSWRVVQ